MSADAIERLEQDVRSLRLQLVAAEAALREARIAACPLKVGDVIELRNKWHEEAPWKGPCRVARVIPRRGYIDFTYNPQKKNGEWSKVKRNAYGGYYREWRHFAANAEPTP
jgi:hypothetical protein